MRFADGVPQALARFAPLDARFRASNHPTGVLNRMAALPVSPHMASPSHDGVRRIAVFRALQLGDLLCAVPVLRALRNAHPYARITLVGLPSSEAIARRFDRYVDDWLDFPGADGLPEQNPRTERLPAFFAEARARRFDLALQLHGSGERSNAIVRMMGAKRSCGFAPANAVEGACEDFLPWPDEGPEIERLLQLVDHLGIERQRRALEFPLDEDERRAWRRIAQRRSLDPGRLVLVHPGARCASRRWPVERFAEVADRLALEGWQVAITGTAGEADLAATMRRAMRTQAVDLSGTTSLGELGAAIESCRLLVCNDTGVSHVAVGVGTRSVVVACGSEIRRWRPLDRSRHPMLAADTACRPCAEPVCPHAGYPCASAIDTNAVFELAMHQLAMSRRRPPVSTSI